MTQAVREVIARMRAACERAGRRPEEVTLVAVSKQQPPEAILAVHAAGVVHFGENRLEEWQQKAVALQTHPGIHWHMIGHVQSRKAKEVVALAPQMIHSLDSLKLAQRYNTFAQDAAIILPVLLQVNVSGEATKSGWDAYEWETRPTLRAALWQEIGAVLRLPGLRVAGLMTMAPLVDDAEQTRPVFRALVTLRQALQQDFPHIAWQHLSMGMTDDFEVAIEEGATLVRIGRAVFQP